MFQLIVQVIRLNGSNGGLPNVYKDDLYFAFNKDKQPIT